MRKRWVVAVVVCCLAFAGAVYVHYAHRSDNVGASPAPTSSSLTGAVGGATSAGGLAVDDEVTQIVNGIMSRNNWELFDKYPSCRELFKEGEKIQALIPKAQMPPEEYAIAKAIYLRYLENYAKIKTASFKVELFFVMDDGSQRLMTEDTILSDLPKFYHEFTSFSPDNPAVRTQAISDGEQACEIRDGKVLVRGKDYRGANSSVCGYLKYYELSMAQQPEPFFVNAYEHLDLNSTPGKARLWSANGNEEVFDLQTGMLVSSRERNGRHKRYAYQQAGDLWFPAEVVDVDPGSEPVSGQTVCTRRRVFSQVTLNAPIDQNRFNIDRSQ